jgi:hypothetical protein
MISHPEECLHGRVFCDDCSTSYDNAKRRLYDTRPSPMPHYRDDHFRPIPKRKPRDGRFGKQWGMPK